MDTKADRKIDMRKAQFWTESVQREEMLRLKWFAAHEELFVEHLNEPIKNKVPESIKEELHKTRQDYHLNREYFPTVRMDEPEPPLVDPLAISEVMRPVDPEVKKIIYFGM